MARSLKHIALIVTIGTLISKFGGLIRQLVIAAAFGLGAAYDAYNYAYVIPGFILVLLGGINGPFHNAVVSILSRKTKRESAYILSVINTLVSAILFAITILLFFLADPIISLIAPSLNPQLHQIAVIQLQIMAPIAFFSGLIGLGFGSLNAAEEFWIPSVSPLMSSLALIIGIGLFLLQFGAEVRSPENTIKGAIVLAIATLIGAILQWLLQLPALIKKGLAKIPWNWDWHHSGVREILSLMAPATLASGMLQINVFTDLFFASGIIGAAAGLGYANLLVQTPLGLISNALLVPLLPTFSRLANCKNNKELIARIRQGVMLSLASMIPLGILFIALGEPIVALVYERGAFDNGAGKVVSELLMAYGLGMPAYLGRDLLVRVFYALGDAITPFKLSIAGIGLNAFFDWLLVGGPSPWGNQLPFSFGATGLVLATVLINILTCSALLLRLQLTIDELQIKTWGQDILKLLFAGLIAGLTLWALRESIIWPNNFPGLILEVSISSALGLCLFGLISSSLGVEEVNELVLIFRQKIIPR